MKKSRYQIANRGRKGKPYWYIEDFKGIEGQAVGKCIATYRVKSMAESHLSWLRAFCETVGVQE